MERMWRKMNQGLISKPTPSGKVRSSHSISLAAESSAGGRVCGPTTSSAAAAAAVPSPYLDNSLATMSNSYPYHVPASTSDAYVHVRNNNSSATSTDSRRKRRRKSKPRCNKNNR